MKFIIILVIALVGKNHVLGYPQDRSSDAVADASAVVPDSKTAVQDSVAAASETGPVDSYDDGDDSDMYMEPDGAESAPVNTQHEDRSEADHESHPEESEQHEEPHDPSAPPPLVTIVAVRPVQTSIQVTSSESTGNDPIVEGTQAHAEKASGQDEKSIETDSQNFFPSFAEIFANQRLPYTDHQTQQQRYRPSRFLGYFQRDKPYQASATTKEAQATLLGSGNFGVIRGGTYYPEDKENDEYNLDESSFNPYYHGNGKGRSNYYKNPKPQPIRGGDFFANFRDFADITAPPKSSFSHLSIVYANKNGENTPLRIVDQPRNIIETLRMLEEEEELQTTTTTEVPTKKLSQNKRKLMKMKKYQEEKARKSRMTLEPLLALS